MIIWSNTQKCTTNAYKADLRYRCTSNFAVTINNIKTPMVDFYFRNYNSVLKV